MIAFPHNLLGFIKYDFAAFMERANDLCRLYVKTGDYKPEEVAEIRASIGGCHKYYEQNIRTVFEKIVIDCWIEYICRQNDYGVVTMWNNYLPCRNDFERAVFTRLSEYRHNRAINQWVNLLRVQEYATRKTDFIFSQQLRGSAQAASRANYFDLIFNVAANEMGFDLSALADNHVFSIGRTPNSPFILSGVSREIMRNLLTDTQPLPDARRHYNPKAADLVSDQTAMDAFSAVKQFIPDNPDNIVNTMIKSLPGVPYKIYVPGSFKAVIDLEIDALIESGAILQHCKRCNEYYLKDEGYNYDYCDRVNREGRSCIEIMKARAAKGEAVTLSAQPSDSPSANPYEKDSQENESRYLPDDTLDNPGRKTEAPPQPLRNDYIQSRAAYNNEMAGDLPEEKATLYNAETQPENIAAFTLHERCDELYKQMSTRVGADITQRDFADWFRYLSIMREKVQNGEASMADFADFERYSLSMKFAADHRRPPEAHNENGYPGGMTKPDPPRNPRPAVKANQNQQVSAAASVTADGKTVKPFVFERVNKSELGGAVSRSADAQFSAEDEQQTPPAYRMGSTAHVLRGVAYNYNQPTIIPTVSSAAAMNANPNIRNVQPQGFESPKQPAVLETVIKQDRQKQVEQEFVRVFEPQSKLRSAQNQTAQKIPAQANPNSDKEQGLSRYLQNLQNYQEFAESSFTDFIPEQFASATARDGKTAFAENHDRQQIRQRGREAKPETGAAADIEQEQELEPLTLSTSTQSGAYAARAYNEAIGANTAAPHNAESTPPENSNSANRREERENRFPQENTKSAASESAVQFSDILRGFERRDSYAEENIPTDADGIPVTHKTKRVMDAIFRQPKSGTLINPAVRDNGEHK
jgi:hypothetical protein